MKEVRVSGCLTSKEEVIVLAFLFAGSIHQHRRQQDFCSARGGRKRGLSVEGKHGIVMIYTAMLRNQIQQAKPPYNL
eukprot:813920-Rhodomonas_salina.1